MVLSEERRMALLAYCRLTELKDDPEVEAVIPVLYEAAVSYMTQAGISPPEAGTARAAQYDLCVNYLVLDYYDHRDIPATTAAAAENPAFRHLISQLKLTDVPETGTSD